MVDVVSWSQPSLLDGGIPMRLRFEVLIDPVDETAVLALEAREYPSATLVALEATGPVPYHRVEDVARELGAKFTAMLREHTAPF